MAALSLPLRRSGDVLCAATKDGAEKWRWKLKQENVDDPKNLGGQLPGWGFCESALIDGDRVLATPGGAIGTVVCWNLQTGEKIWQSSDITELAHYSSILAVKHFGKRQYIQLTATKLFGLDESGKLLWETSFPGSVAVIPTPIYRDGLVYVTSGYGAGCKLVRVGEDNSVEVLYENKVMKNHHGGVLLSETTSMATPTVAGLFVRICSLESRFGRTASEMKAKARSLLRMACFIVFQKTKASVFL
jgi:WD40 repeat protein